jgi:hypothetical protein
LQDGSSVAISYAPFGLRQNRNLIGAAGNFQANIYSIKKGYASAIGFGDPVITLGGGNQGYIGPYAETGTHILGVLVGILPYYDLTLQQLVNKNWYAGTENPSGDIQAMVIDDPNQTFILQMNGGPITVASRGLNADITSPGAPNTFGVSTAALDFSTIATTGTLPLRIIGPAQMSIGGVDPTISSSILQQYGYAEVCFNTSEYRQTTGV